MPKMYAWFIPDAEDIYLDDTNLPFTADDVQEGFEKMANLVAISASPGFTWGRSGEVNGGAWLLNDTVVSSVVGRNFPLHSGFLKEVSISNELVNTFTVGIYEHDHVTYTQLTTISLTTEIRKVALLTGISVTYNKELAIKIESGKCKNPVVQLILTGGTV